MNPHPKSIEDLRGMVKAHATLRSRLKAAAWLWLNRCSPLHTFSDIADAANVSREALAKQVAHSEQAAS